MVVEPDFGVVEWVGWFVDPGLFDLFPFVGRGIDGVVGEVDHGGANVGGCGGCRNVES